MLGKSTGTVWLDDVKLQSGRRLEVWRRDFSGGISLVNPTEKSATVDLGGTFRKITGTQAPSVNDGSLVTAVTLAPHDGIVLLLTSAPPADTTKPSVFITAPLSGAAVSGSVALAAAASDNVGVSRVEFRVDGTLVLSDTAAPYAATWNAAAAAPGSHTITATVYDAAGNTSVATVSVTRPDTTAPGAPTGVSAVALSTTSIGVSWTASSDASGINEYRVYSGGALRATVTGTSATVTGLVPSTSYSFSVVAVDNAGNVSGNSATASATTPSLPDTTAPAAPTGVVAATLGTDSIRVSWSASSDASGIKEYRVSMNGALQVTVTGTSATVTGLAAGTSYSFSVVAVDNAGNVSGNSATASATTDPVPVDTTPPTVPTGVTATATGPTSIAVSWDSSYDLSGIKHYLVYMNGALRATVTGTSTTVTGLLPQTPYSFSVVAVDNASLANVSGYSSSVSVTTPATPVDTVAPVISVSGVANGSTYSAPVTIMFSASDAGSGLAIGQPSATLDGAQFTNGSSVSTNGLHTLVVTAVDRSGNTARHTRTFTIAEVASRVVTKVLIRGTSRIHTAVAASTAAFETSEYVVIATGYDWPDALGGSALAGALDAPILLTYQNSLPGEVAAEIARLGAKRAIVLGGPAAVSLAVEDKLKKLLGAGNVERTAGADRYETANKVAARTIALLGPAYDGTAFVATGANFPDALGASPLAVAKGWPIYLANPRWRDDAGLVAAMKAAGVTRTLVLGSANAVSSTVESRLWKLGSVTRLAGANRYDTAISVARYGVANAGLAWDKLAMATGQDFADALAGAVLQGKSDSIMLLTPTASMNSEAAAAIKINKATIREVRFLGATTGLSDSWTATD
jgi:putative cell wall-binding protein/chitodextrinase